MQTIKAKVIILPTEGIIGGVSQHLYLTTDEEIKEGDWFINDDGIWKCKNNIIPSGLNPRKIVATTNTSLWEHDDTVPYPKTRPALPQISQEFLKEYCEAGGKIDEVKVEIELKSIPVNTEIPIAGFITYHDLKVDSNNCVIVHTVKKFWTKEEVEDILFDISTELSWDDKDEDELILSCQSKIEEIKKNL